MRLNKIADKNYFLLSSVSKKYEIKMLEEDQNLIGKECEENLWQVQDNYMISSCLVIRMGLSF